MSSINKIRLLLGDFSVSRLWSAWRRSCIVNTIVKRCRKEGIFRDVVHAFRQTLFRPRHTLLLSATAVCRAGYEDNPLGCHKTITDQELQGMVDDLESVEELSKLTLFCTKCDKRILVDRLHPGITYCSCKESHAAEKSHQGWTPYMEAEDVIVWRKEYNRPGAYAYKIYGRYNEIRADDFSAIQVDGIYRRIWDQAVAALAVVENNANGVKDQAVLHWEVLWPKLFANRDYVYIRRHKQFPVQNRSLPHKDRLFSNAADQKPAELTEPQQYVYPQTENVHSRAKRKSEEMERDRLKEEAKEALKDNKVYLILSRSCEHPSVPEAKHAIRVTEYWSHMVIRTLNGYEQAGMEYVLTYYDDPAAGTMPSGMTSWATGRAVPTYLDKMRRAADHYRDWLSKQPLKEEDDDETEDVSVQEEQETPEECANVIEKMKIAAFFESYFLDETFSKWQRKHESTQTDPESVPDSDTSHSRPDSGGEKVN